MRVARGEARGLDDVSTSLRVSALALLLLACSGCHTFEPATLESLAPGHAVRASLSAAGAERVRERIGEGAPLLEGTFVTADPESVLFEVWRTDLALRTFQPGRIEVPLPRGEIVGLERRRLSLLRTGALGVGIAGGIYLLLRAVWGDAGGFLGVDGGDGI